MNQNSSSSADFLQTVIVALAHLKRELQSDYERAYPALREIIHLVLEEEETKAWKMSRFPHLIFPDLVEAHIAKLSLRPVETHRRGLVAPRAPAEFPMFQPAFA
jgi:gluconate kinase